jgi:hypothetical protein
MTQQPPQPPGTPSPQKSQEMLNKMSEQSIIDSILKNMPTSDEVEVLLPSKNKFYSLIDPSKPITLRPMTFEDERAMMSNKNVNIDVLNTLLSRCVSNIQIGSLLQIDKLFLVMKLRELSYGDDYNASINCNGCKKDNSVVFTLSNLPITYLEDDATDPILVKLPVLDKEVKIKMPRIQDEEYFSNADYTIKNLWRFVEEIDGHSEKSVISKIIPQLPLKDAHVLLESLSGQKYGVETKVRFVCNYCSHNEVMELPITPDFFTGT